MPHRLFDASGAIGAGVVSVMGVVHAYMTLALSEVTGADQFILQLVKEGGAWAVVALLIYFYRRDWQRLADQTQPLMEIAQHSTQAQERTAAALENNTDVLKELVKELRHSRQERRA